MDHLQGYVSTIIEHRGVVYVALITKGYRNSFPLLQGPNFGLKSGGTNSEGEF